MIWISFKRSRNWLLIIFSFTAICWDIATSHKYAAEYGTFRYESEFPDVLPDTAIVAIVTSDYAALTEKVPRNIDPGYEQIEVMVRKAVEMQGGLQHVVTKGDKVMLKVNLVGANSPSGQGENTDVRVVKALMKIIREITAGDVEIWIAEGSARVNDDPVRENSVWQNSGYTVLIQDPDLADINFSLLNLNRSIDDLVEVNLGTSATAAPHNGKYYVHKAELDADVYISIPVLKIHDTGITCALKNQIGTAPGVYYGYNKMTGSQYSAGLLHDVDQRRWTTEEIVDFSSIAGIDFVLVDAIMCLDSSKSYHGSNQVRFNAVVAGEDPVAVDHIGSKLFCLNPDDIAHITLAAKMGLGTNHPDRIKVVGVPVETAKIKVRKNPSPNGLFGQSNRTWLLSQTFAGSDISQEYLPDESSLAPEAGQEGWSPSVYFFDDRIDLMSYYQEPAGVITYAFTRFFSPLEQQAELWLGYDESIMVYLNQEKVFTFDGSTTFEDSELVKAKPLITVIKGENLLLVKTFHKYADYSFTLNICQVESDLHFAGNRLPGLVFYTSKTLTPTSSSDLSVNSGGSLMVYPNPLVNQAKISFVLPEEGKTSLALYDMNGRLVEVILEAHLEKGNHTFDWNVCGKGEKVIPGGNYLCVLQSPNYRNSIKIHVLYTSQ
jgi:uncharacterized protein (DUF362 family)